MAQYKEYRAKEKVLIEGEESNELYYIAKGTLRVLLTRGDDNKQLATLHPGEVVGEMSFLDKKSRSASVEAISDSVLQVIERQAYEDFLSSLPPWFISLQNTLIDRLRNANSRVDV